ncbi:4-hydroxybenzoate 3-monooxygenase [Streptomyces sp. AV19]|uniref:4-hydroxybenzoate 3-monooxygenase n=1 Tax=Streptomyces sp. AV19 TaxID=2793068 RepID=UPI0018FE0555|nr:4-hydroxybenzoate 3-monooxygenase [Streptomyces sp. AV19]MBH1932986.1 4-hydroxybenzoate 3-monooxygenase [Streptomyces sp. AV19]MDG4533841.1 4-hydroxybenzoate 3-monooxygenase [Streptomyces sp. AV19]
MTHTQRTIRTQVAIVGAGPAGLVLACVLLRAGISVEIVERQSREAVERRARAGLVEHRVVEYLRAHRLADGLVAHGVQHGWCDFLSLGERLRVDYAAHTGGAAHWVYPQQFLVRDLITALEEAGGRPHFARPATAVHAPAGGQPRLRCPGFVVEADYLVGCDGHHGITRDALPAAVRDDVSHRYPYDWLTVLTEVDRPVEGVVYAVHERGFAGMMPRTGRLARCYLQVPAEDTLARWPRERVREELDTRLHTAHGGLPRIGRLTDTGILRMRSTISQRLRHGRVFLAGDAAHLLAPAGAKGMNAAVADAADLAEALVRHYRDRDDTALDAYSARRLEEVWRVQAFADRLLTLLNTSTADGHDARFALRLKLEHIRRLAETGPFGTDFARQYAGAGALLPPAPTPATGPETP